MAETLDTLRHATETAVLRGPGATSPALRQAVARDEAPEDLQALVAKIHQHAYKVTNEDLAALRGRYTEDQLFELIVAATFGAADARLQAALRVLDEAVPVQDPTEQACG